MNLVPVHGSPALHFEEESALLLSDLHYGVEAEMLRDGVWIHCKRFADLQRVPSFLPQTLQ